MRSKTRPWSRSAIQMAARRKLPRRPTSPNAAEGREECGSSSAGRAFPTPANNSCGPNWRYHCFVTNVDLGTVDADAFHRDHATVELAIRDLKEGSGLEHCPSGKFFANAAWLGCAVLAHDLVRWTARLGKIHPAIRAHRRPHRAHACARLARSPRQPQRSADPPTPKSLALGIQLSQRARRHPLAAARDLSTTRAVGRSRRRSPMR